MAAEIAVAARLQNSVHEYKWIDVSTRQSGRARANDRNCLRREDVCPRGGPSFAGCGGAPQLERSLGASGGRVPRRGVIGRQVVERFHQAR